MIASPALDTDFAVRPATAARPVAAREPDVLEVLLEALVSRERYRLVERDGEIFIEPASAQTSAVAGWAG